MKKFTKGEKQMIALLWRDGYFAYRCHEHKTFIQSADVANGQCPYCKTACKEIPKMSELKEAFKKELKL